MGHGDEVAATSGLLRRFVPHPPEAARAMSVQAPVGGHVDVKPMVLGRGAQASVVGFVRFAVGGSIWQQQPVRASHRSEAHEPAAAPQMADRYVGLARRRCCTASGKIGQ